ncbi:hypothetical protein [Cupriavidus basilensis]|nr:hypothetical protein [Cupriavidus basilensis]
MTIIILKNRKEDEAPDAGVSATSATVDRSLNDDRHAIVMA